MMEDAVALGNRALRRIVSTWHRMRFAWPILAELLIGILSGGLGLVAGTRLFAPLARDILAQIWAGDPIGALNLALNQPNLGYEIVGLTLTVLSIVLLVTASLRAMSMLTYKIEIVPRRHDENAAAIEAYAGDSNFKVIVAGGQALVYEPKTCAILDEANTPLELNQRSYALPEPLERYRAPLLSKAPGVTSGTFDGAKIRLASSVNHAIFAGNAPVSLQRTSYFRDRITNNLASQTVTYRNHPVLNVMEWNLDSKGRLKDFVQSPFSNQLGGSCLLITSDFNLVYVIQGNSSDENASKLAPSGSGSFDWKDIALLNKRTAQPTFQALARLGIERELAEETKFVADADTLHILVGIGRYVYRSGKPEVFSLVFSRASSTQLRVRAQEWDYIKPDLRFEQLSSMAKFSSARRLATDLRAFAEKVQVDHDAVSGPLVFNCILAADYLSKAKNATARIKSFLEGAGA